MSLPARTQPDMAPVFRDALGERHLVFDPRVGASLEVLRFAPEFSRSAEFESALRARVEALRHLQHPSFGSIHSVDRDGSSLILSSRLTVGRRISELQPKAHGAGFALELIRLVTPALAALQHSGDGVAHGVLSADRIIVTRDGRLVVVEHVLGSAIQTLRLPRHRLLEMGVVAQPTDGDEPVALDGRFDLTQLGFLAVSLLLGRKLDPADYPAKVPLWLDEFVIKAASPMLAARLRIWLERALQVSHFSFASPHDAQAAIGMLPDDMDGPVASAPAQSQPASTAFVRAVPAHKPVIVDASALTDLRAHPEPRTHAEVDAHLVPPAHAEPSAHTDPPAHTEVHAHIEPPAHTELLAHMDPPARTELPALHVSDASSMHDAMPALPPPARGGIRWSRWAMAAIALLAVGEGVLLFVQPYLRPATEVVEVRPVATPVPVPDALPAPPLQSPNALTADGTAAAATAPLATASLAPSPAPDATLAAAPTPTPTSAPPIATDAAPAAAPGPRFGGLTVTSRINLQVLEAGRLLGSTAGPIAINEGPHTFELVNEELGFRLTQTVTVRAGRMTTVQIDVPKGRLSINALPWADVDINGTPAGQTPLANLSLPIGTHELTFHHPQLGTRKQTVVVKVDGLAKVTQTFQPGGGRP